MPREGIVLLDAQQCIVGADGATAQLFDHAAAALQGMAFEALLAAPSRAAASGRIAPAAAAMDPPGLPSGALFCSGQRRDGSQFPLALTVTPMATPGGGDAARCVVRLRAHHAGPSEGDELQMLRLRLRTLVDLAPIAIWVAEGEEVVLANRAAARLVGCAAGDDLIGMSVFRLLDREGHEAMRRALEQALQRAGEATRLPARLLRLDGEPREVEIALAALPDHGRTTVQMVVNDVTQRNREQRELELSRQALRRLSANAVEAREEERQRLARELHDELGQGLAALKMEIVHHTGAANPPLTAGMQRILSRIDTIVQSVRRISHDLRPPMLDDLGLADALSALAGEFSRRTGIPVHLDIGACDPPPAERVTIALYRMVQEALTNIGRHAGATQAVVALERDGDDWVLDVRDDGVGLPDGATGRDSRFGLLGMRERATMLGGGLEVRNRPEGGAQLRVRLPAAPAPAPRSGGRRGG